MEQAFQAIAENVGGNALGGAGEILEAGAAEHEIPDDEKRPAVAK